MADAVYSEKLGADALGFIFYRNSKRYIEPESASKIINELSPFTIKVGVFVNAEAYEVNRISKNTGINLVQLHGEESVEYIKKIDLPVIKAFRVDETFDFDQLNHYKKCTFLLDSLSTENYGGTGEKFNWNVIPKEVKNKIILAGGIGIDDLDFIKSNISPYAIDLSSSIEIEPGVKDHQKLKNFFKKIKSKEK